MDNNVVKFNIDIIDKYANDKSEDFAIVQIQALSDGFNHHKLSISNEVLKRDAKTVLGKPIVAKLDRNVYGKEDFKGHETDEVVIGYVPPNAEIKFPEKENGTFFQVDAVIFKLYSGNTVDIFKRDGIKSVSCEFTYNYSNDVKNIDAFEIRGITILGSDDFGNQIEPSCVGANAKIIQFSEKDAENRYETYTNKNNPKEKFAIEIGDRLWMQVYELLCATYPNSDGISSKYSLRGIYEELNGDKYIIIDSYENGLYKIGLNLSENEGISLKGDLEKVKIDFVIMQSKEDVQLFEQKYKEEKMAEKDKEKEKEVTTKEAEAEEEEDEVKDKEEEKEKMSKLIEEQKETINAQLSELEVLREFKEKIQMAEKEKIVDNALKDVKEYVDEAKFSELKQEAESCKFEDIENWQNKVLATITKTLMSQNAKKNEGIMEMGMPKEAKKELENIYDYVPEI